MQVPAFLAKNYDNFFFNKANEWQERSIMHNEKKEYVKAWGWSLCSRLTYLADLIVSAVSIPLALLGILFGFCQSFVTWGRETAFIDYFGHKLVEKVNHVFLSLIGAVISPWLANKGKDLYQASSEITRYRNNSLANLE